MLRDLILVVIGGALLLGAIALGQGMVKTERYVDAAGAFQLDIPNGWYVEKQQQNFEGPEPDWSLYTQPVRIKPQAEDIPWWVDVYVYEFLIENTRTANNLNEVWEHRTVDQFNTYQWTTVNRYRALYNYLDFVGPGEVESYIDHTYIVDVDGRILGISFREVWRHDWNPETYFNAAIYKDDFERIVHSISKPKTAH